MVFSDAVYNKLKWIASYLLPGLTTLWLALGKVWGFPYTAEIGATLAAITVFLNGLLGISNKNYNGDGEITIDNSNPEQTYKVLMTTSLSDISEKKKVTLKVNQEG